MIRLHLLLSGHAATRDAAMIIQQSQAFSDASASGDAKMPARYADNRFMDENGRLAIKKNLLAHQ